MTELREFARHSEDLAKLDVRLVPISVDDQRGAHDAWEKVAERKFSILSDPGAAVIRKYGLLHEHGHENGEDIALRTTILIAPDGREKWRRVSRSVPDIPSWKETQAEIKAAQSGIDTKHRLSKNGGEMRMRTLRQVQAEVQ
jgi:peroxiredoxin